MTLFNDGINVGFDCDINRTRRVNQVFDAFGLDIDNYHHVVIDNLYMPKNWDIVYVTGISGSGKSTLLRTLANQYKFDFDTYNTVSFQRKYRRDNTPIIDLIGTSFEDALSYLNSVGLSEAFIYFKRFYELSDGQKYRFFLAKLLELDHKYIFVDEFTSLLDRITANIVAYNYQKAVRRLEKKLVVATSHTDLNSSLRPSHTITFDYSGHHKLTKHAAVATHTLPPFVDEMRIVSTNRSDTELLQYHYKNTKLPAMVSNMFSLVFRGVAVGLIVYSIPIRTYMLEPFLVNEKERERYNTLSVNEKRLLSGNNVAIVSRIVIHPTFRGIGLGAYLLKESMLMVNKRLIILSSVMSNYVAFCESAGMTYVEPKSNVKFNKLNAFYEKHNINSERLSYDPVYRREVIARIKKSGSLFEEFKELIALYIKRHFSSLGDRGEEESAKLASDKIIEKYLLKLRPIPVKTYTKINDHVKIDSSSIKRFRSKLFAK